MPLFGVFFQKTRIARRLLILQVLHRQVLQPGWFWCLRSQVLCVRSGLSSHYFHYFHIIGDGKLNPIVGVFIPIIRIHIKRWEVSHPPRKRDNLDHGTCEFWPLMLLVGGAGFVRIIQIDGVQKKKFQFSRVIVTYGTNMIIWLIWPKFLCRIWFKVWTI